jgi:hypothetical protein
MTSAERVDMTFTHEVRDIHYQFDDADPFMFEAPPSARIHMEVEEDGNFWLSANSEGYLHLARVCAELGLRKLEDGYHVHMDADFDRSAGPPEFTFALDNSVKPPESAEDLQ